MTPRKKSLLVLIGLSFIFIAPSLMAYLTFKYKDTLPLKQANYGKLINPLIPMNDLGLKQDYQPINENFSHKWVLILLSQHRLPLKKIDELNRVRLALGKELSKLDLWLVTDSKHQDNSLLQQKFQMNLFYVSPNKLSQFSTGEGRLYLMDPQGYLMMSYSYNFKKKAVYSDLKRLLKSNEM